MLSNVNKSFEPIVLIGKLSYQDINGKNFEKNFELKFIATIKNKAKS